MSVILWKILIVSIILFLVVVCAFCTWRVVALIKRVKQLQKDRDDALEAWYRVQREKPTISDMEKRMILNALGMGEYKNWVEDPKTKHEVRKIYRELVERLKESMGD